MSSRNKRHNMKATPKRSQAAAKRQMATDKEREHLLGLYDGLQFDAAQRNAESLTRRYPEDAFCWKVLGSCMHKNGHIEASKEVLETSLALDEGDAQTQHLMARAWYDLGDPVKALSYAQHAVALEPGFAQGHYTLAEILSESDRDNEALVALTQSESLGYQPLQCAYLRFQILVKRRRFGEANELVPELLAKGAENASIQNGVGNLYKEMGRYEEAETAYRNALALNPDFDMAFSNLVITMHYNPAISAEQIYNTIREWDSHFPSQTAPYAHGTQVEEATKRLRIGLISSGFRRHPVGEMSVTGLENLSTGLELHFYSTNNADDPITRRLKNIASSWNLVRHLSKDALADKIYQDGIDILFDLSGFGDGDRIRTMRRKPAPLIVKWVGGLINTMGLECYDYLLSDNYETPEGADEWYIEKLIRMPDDYICYLPAPDAPAITALPAMTNGYITLGCFNNPAKINASLLTEWARLMHELPDSRLFLKSGQYENAEYCDRIRSIMAEQGIVSERLIMEGGSPHDELLAAYNRVDIALDPWPYSGGLTTCEAFMMGVPVVTLPGPTFAGRHSATHLINAGMPELVTFTWDEYRQKVIELSSDIPNLSVIRACLRRFLMQSPVCDSEKFGKNFSRAMRAIWQRHCEGKAPAALTLDQKGQAFFEDSPEPVAIKKPQPALEQNGFRWDFEGKIIAVDNGGQLLDNPTVKSLVDQDLLEIIVFDPVGSAADSPMSQYEGVHYFAHNGLGDGSEGSFQICSDPAMNSLLEPLSDEQLDDEHDANEVVSREPFTTVTLNSLDGLPSLDWLVLDDLSDSAAILEHGGEALKDTLLIQIKVAFQPTHERQPNLAEVQHWASRNGFRFYRLNEMQHYSNLPPELIEKKSTLGSTASELISAQALLLPTETQMASLEHQQRIKLALLLHTVYGLKEMSYCLLRSANDGHASNYFEKFIQPETTSTLTAQPKTLTPHDAATENDFQNSDFEKSNDTASHREQEINENIKEKKENIIYLEYPLIYGVELFKKGVLVGQKKTGVNLKKVSNKKDIIDQIINAGSNDIIFTGHSFYNLSITAPPYINQEENIFDIFKKIPFCTIDDHAYADFMLSRCKNSPKKMILGSSSNKLMDEFEAIATTSDIHKIRLPLKIPATDPLPFGEKQDRAVFLGKLYPGIEKTAAKLLSRIKKERRLSSNEKIWAIEMFNLRENNPFYSPENEKLRVSDLALLYYDLIDKFFRNYHRERELEKIAAAFKKRKISLYVIGGSKNEWSFKEKENCTFMDRMNYTDALDIIHGSRYIINLTPSYPDSLPKRALDAMCSNGLCITDNTPFYDRLHKESFYYDAEFVESTGFENCDIEALSLMQKDYIMQYCNEELVAQEWANAIRLAQNIIKSSGY